ncbi:MAG: UvrD-helicase domain-containing protein [Brevundimonas sp.]
MRRRPPATASDRRPPLSHIFIDESQDTQPAVIEALRQIACEEPLCVGFFGDPMQKIYGAGAGAIALNEGWADITKPENFR